MNYDIQNERKSDKSKGPGSTLPPKSESKIDITLSPPKNNIEYIYLLQREMDKKYSVFKAGRATSIKKRLDAADYRRADIYLVRGVNSSVDAENEIFKTLDQLDFKNARDYYNAMNDDSLYNQFGIEDYIIKRDVYEVVDIINTICDKYRYSSDVSQDDQFNEKCRMQSIHGVHSDFRSDERKSFDKSGICGLSSSTAHLFQKNLKLTDEIESDSSSLGSDSPQIIGDKPIYEKGDDLRNMNSLSETSLEDIPAYHPIEINSSQIIENKSIYETNMNTKTEPPILKFVDIQQLKGLGNKSQPMPILDSPTTSQSISIGCETPKTTFSNSKSESQTLIDIILSPPKTTFSNTKSESQAHVNTDRLSPPVSIPKNKITTSDLDQNPRSISESKIKVSYDHFKKMFERDGLIYIVKDKTLFDAYYSSRLQSARIYTIESIMNITEIMFDRLFLKRSPRISSQPPIPSPYLTQVFIIDKLMLVGINTSKIYDPLTIRFYIPNEAFKNEIRNWEINGVLESPIKLKWMRSHGYNCYSFDS